MPDLSVGFDVPNPYGLRAADFNYDVPSYTVALGFLSDLAGGSDHDEALTANGGSHAMKVGWERSPAFRRVYAKCKAAGKAEQEALRARVSDSETNSERGAGIPSGQRFIPLEEMPVRRSPFDWSLRQW